MVGSGGDSDDDASNHETHADGRLPIVHLGARHPRVTRRELVFPLGDLGQCSSTDEKHRGPDRQKEGRDDVARAISGFHSERAKGRKGGKGGNAPVTLIRGEDNAAIGKRRRSKDLGVTAAFATGMTILVPGGHA